MNKKPTLYLSLFLLFSLLPNQQQAEETTPKKPVTVECDTSEGGPLVIEVHPEWAPLAAHQFLNLVLDGYYDHSPLFRVVKHFLVQFGISLNEELESKWGSSPIDDDPNIGIPFSRGTVSFAGSGVNSRTTQIFITYSDEAGKHLGKVPHETPFGKVISGMKYADEFFDGEGEFSMDLKPWGNGPEQHRIKTEGSSYLEKNYPKLSYIQKCVITPSSIRQIDPEERLDPEKAKEEKIKIWSNLAKARALAKKKKRIEEDLKKYDTKLDERSGEKEKFIPMGKPDSKPSKVKQKGRVQKELPEDFSQLSVGELEKKLDALQNEKDQAMKNLNDILHSVNNDKSHKAFRHHYVATKEQKISLEKQISALKEEINSRT
eukprot:CAMPEP_0201482260 /NCGR_PEP_ID=MMETSP0151_2-20130828/6546_1 /ASSEMBLY_ACC=CAM_ASM_000257 /TAXON_ID=200890 /ORGANISM="Paramoeba atlantica, Strain 621/1 / CCAP 1560/9" /LENGTH=374 /DNA_ID=CAMNT_0047864881 /DNA_START=23 /DNA_END=1144 /DNA_ORIENTATION=-